MDKFVSFQSNCQVGYKYTPTTTITANRGSPSCLVIKEWSNQTLTARYEDYLECGNVANYGTIQDAIIEFQQAQLNYEQSVDSVFGEINTSFGVVSGKVSELAENTANLVQAVQTYFNKDVFTLFDEMFGPNQGIYNNLQCNYLNGEYMDMKKAVCQNAMPSLMIVFSMALLGSFLIFLLMFIYIFLHQGFLKANS